MRKKFLTLFFVIFTLITVLTFFTACNKGGSDYDRDGDTVTMGMYPQTRVTDEKLIAALSESAGELPVKGDGKKWTSYGYLTYWHDEETGEFKEGPSDDMFYIDIEYGSAKYRGVHVIEYRNLCVGDKAEDYDVTDEYYIALCKETFGCEMGKTYWFKWEPLKWTVAEEKNGEALLVCEQVIDGQMFGDSEFLFLLFADTEDVAMGPCNYSMSSIRTWLNDTFLKTAFDETQIANIVVSNVDNGLESYKFSGTIYGYDYGYDGETKCDEEYIERAEEYLYMTFTDTQDKVFLLSLSEASGLNESVLKKTNTDYARIQGARFIDYNVDVDENNSTMVCRWLLRSAGVNEEGFGVNIVYGGAIGSLSPNSSRTLKGIVPAIRVKL